MAANPNTGVYIVTADGHIYSWTKDGETAIDLGVYQATGIDKNDAIIQDMYRFIDETDNSKRLVSLGNGYWWQVNEGATKVTLHKSVSSTLLPLNCLQPIRAKKGDKFILKTRGFNTAHAYYVTDKDFNVLYDSGNTKILWPKSEIEISNDNAYYLLVNQYEENDSLYFPSECYWINSDSDEKLREEFNISIQNIMNEEFIQANLSYREIEIEPIAPRVATFWVEDSQNPGKIKLGSNLNAFEYLRACKRIPCFKGNKFYLKVRGENTAVGYFVTDANGNILDRSVNAWFTGIYTCTNDDACWLYTTKNKNYEYKCIWLDNNFQIQLDNAVIPNLGNNPEWSVPSKVYSIINQDKVFYWDNLTNKNVGSPAYTIGIDSNGISNLGYDVDNEKIKCNYTTTGNKTMALTVWGANNSILTTKNITIEVLANTLNKKINICCIGDSITEGQNMPYYAKQKLINVLTNDSIQPTFVGTKGGPSGMAQKDCYHEGWYGRSLQFLASDSQSPFINNGQLDITNYRNNHINLPNDTIDVVSIAMGWNGTASDTDRNNAWTAMQNIMNAFLADNENTIFIIQMLTYPANAEGDNPQTNRCNQNQKWRKKVLDAYDNNQNSHVLLGDMGNCYDRKRAYPTSTKTVSPYYSDTVKYSTDYTHPNATGTQQLGENLAFSLLKAAQLAATLKQ